MGIFDIMPADPNIDNPKRFVIYVISFILILVILIGGYGVYANWSKNKAVSGTTGTTTDQTTGTVTKGGSTSGKGTASNAGIQVPVGYDALITYTDTGFKPATLQVKAGTSVRFINKSGGTMRIMSVQSSNATAEYKDFDQAQSVGRNGTYDFSFTRRGTWLYENLNNPKQTGVIVVN